MTSKLSIQNLLAQSESEFGRFAWEGTFADYLAMVCRDPSVSRLSHALIYDAILAEGVEETTSEERVYGLFKHEIFGLESALDSIIQYFASSAQRLEIRKRIILLLGPPASGKSSIVELTKRALEKYTRTDEGAVYAIKGCPMQEEPLHLIPEQLRPKLLSDYGVYVEGDLCPRCRYVLRTEAKGNIAEMPVTRVVFSEYEAVGIGYYVATNPNPTDASLLVGSVDSSKLDGSRLEVAGKAFRMDGEFNVANRGVMEFVEIFKADKNMLTTLLGLAQEQLIKMERFGSVYADESIMAHSNEGDFAVFASDEHSEALRDRIIAIQVPYNLRVSEEVKIYQKMLGTSTLHGVHVAPLALPVVSTFAIFSRLEPPPKQGMGLIDKLRLYDGKTVPKFTKQDVIEMQRHSPSEGMSGISPRYVMNRLASVAGDDAVSCIMPLAALNSMWEGLNENVSLDSEDLLTYIGFVVDTVKEYNAMAVRQLQLAYQESFEQSAAMSLNSYLEGLDVYVNATNLQGVRGSKERAMLERDLRDMERYMGVNERNKIAYRNEIYEMFTQWKKKGLSFDYTTEPRIRAAIEAQLFQPPKKLERDLSEPRFTKKKVEWAGRREAIVNRLIKQYGYCEHCAGDVIDYVVHVLKSKPVVKTPKSEGVEWNWALEPAAADSRSGG